MSAIEYLTINELPVAGAGGLFAFEFAGGYLEREHVKLDFVTALGARTNYPLDDTMFVTDFTLQIPVIDIPANAVNVRIYRETPRDLPLVNFTTGSRLTERNLDRLAQQTIFVAAEAFDAGAFAVAEDLIGQALQAIEDANALLQQSQGIVAQADASATDAAASASAAATSALDAAASALAAANSESTVAASALAAANSAAAALASETAAAGSASAAAGSADAASTSASNASASSASAASSASDALSSANAANASALAADASADAAALSEAAAAASAASAAATAANFPGRNRIINGKMEVAQRGTTFAAVANAAYTLDRWQHFDVSAAVGTVSQSTSVPNDEFQNSLLYSCTTADATVEAGDYVFIRQAIEGFNVRHLIGKDVVLSFWVRSRKAGVHCVAFGNSISDRTFIREYTVNAADTWEKKSVTIPGGLITAGTWNWTNGIGLTVAFILMAGATYHTAAGAWQAGNFLATANQVNLLDATGDALRITGVQLESGLTATPFEHRFIGQELALCQRYYERTGVVFSGAAATGTLVHVYWKAVKRAAPTLTILQNGGSGAGLVNFTLSAGTEGFYQSSANSVTTNGLVEGSAEL